MSERKRYTDDYKNKVVTQLLQGKSVNQICIQEGIASSTL